MSKPRSGHLAGLAGQAADIPAAVLGAEARRSPGDTPAAAEGDGIYRLLFHTSGEPLILMDGASLEILAVTAACGDLLGLDPATATGVPLSRLPGQAIQDPEPELSESCRRALSQGPQLVRCRLQDRRGQEHRAELRLEAVPLADRTYLVGRLQVVPALSGIQELPLQSEGALCSLLDALQDVALLLDSSGRILAANQTAKLRLGRGHGEVIGRNVFDLMPPQVAAFRQAQMDKVLRTGKTIYFEDENAGRHLFNMLYPIFDTGGKVSHVGVYAMDVTEARKTQKELARTKNRLQCLLDHVPVALYGCRPDDCGHLSYISKSIERLTGFTAEEILADPFFWCQLIHPDDRPLYLQRRGLPPSAEHQTLEYRLRHKDGTYRWLYDEFTLVRNAQGEPLEYIGSLLDVTAAREARDSLARSEARYRAIVECQNDLICRFSSDTTLIYLNEAVCRFWQAPAEELLGSPFAELLTDSSRRDFLAWLTSFTPDRPAASREYEAILPTGEHRWLSWMVYAFFDDGDRIREYQAVGRDITERVRAEQALRQSEQRFRTFTENSLVGILLYQEGVLRYVNPALAEMFGYEPAEMIGGLDVLELVHPDHRDLIRTNIAARLAGAPPEQYCVNTLHRDGRIIRCEIASSRIIYENRPALLVIVNDITQRWEMEAALRASEEKFRFLVENMNDGLGISDAEGRIAYVNRKFCEIIGYTEAELLGRPVTELLDEDNQKILQEQISLRRLGYDQPYQLVWTRKDGTQVPTQISPRPLFDDQGRYQGSFAILTDITAYRQTEADLQRREQYFRQLTDNVSDIIGLLDGKGVITYLNPSVERLLGLNCWELVGTSIFSLVHPASAAGLRERFRRLLDRAEEGFDLVVRVRDRQGSWHVWHLKGKNLLHDPVVAGVVINAQDITEQKKLEEALQQAARKLRALTAQIFAAQERERRRLSLELHDELGQSLTALKLQLRSIANKLRRDQQQLKEECSQMLNYINEVVENVRRLSHDLCPSLLENVGLGAALRQLLENFRQFYKVTDKLQDLDASETHLPDTAKIHLYRIFQELLTNIEKHAQAKSIRVEVQRLDKHLAMVVADDGVGFPGGVVDLKSSTGGLGLQAVSERIHMLGGSLEITTREKAGTKVSWTVPLQQKPLRQKRG